METQTIQRYRSSPNMCHHWRMTIPLVYKTLRLPARIGHARRLLFHGVYWLGGQRGLKMKAIQDLQAMRPAESTQDRKGRQAPQFYSPREFGISRQKRKFQLVFAVDRPSIASSMRSLAAIGALCFLATCSLASAQVSVSAQTARSNFLLYERVDLIVTVANTGESDLVLDNDEGHPWLSFLVSKHNRLPVHPERAATFKPLTLKVGESKTLRINLTPLFSFREEGDYKAEAVIDLPGAGQILSDAVPFTVLKGRQVWTQTRPVNGSQRVYSLVRFSPKPDLTNLYLRVEDPSENIVLANLSLGEVVAYIDPEVFFDPQGNLHVMQPIASGTYLYTRADTGGKIVHQGIFKTFQTIPPRLTKLADGNVIVIGGLEEDPNAPRETLSYGQIQAKGQIEKRPDAPGAEPNPGSDSAPTPAPASDPEQPPAPTPAPSP
jgi:hypothetical protein